MDKKKRRPEQRASIRTSKGRPQAKVTKGRNRSASYDSFRRYQTRVTKPSRRSTDIEEDSILNPQAEAEETREVTAQAVPISGLFAGFGGIDGIISMMGKANQMFRLFQQMTPIFKMFGFLGGGAKATTSSLRVNRKSITHKRAKNKRPDVVLHTSVKSKIKR